MTQSNKPNIDKSVIDKAKKAKLKAIDSGKVVLKNGNTKV